MHGVYAVEVVFSALNNQDMRGFDKGTVHILLLQKNRLHAIIYHRNLQRRHPDAL